MEVSCDQVDAEMETVKFVDNVAWGEEGWAKGHDIYAEGTECYVDVTCNDATEFCDACNTTDFTSTNYLPTLTCTNSKKGQDTCLGDDCTVGEDTCSKIYLIPTSITCDGVPDSGDICCIENGAACLGDMDLPLKSAVAIITVMMENVLP